MIELEFDRRLRAWLEVGPTGPSPWVVDGALRHAATHPQRRPPLGRWLGETARWLTWVPSGRGLRLAMVMTVLAVLAFSGGLYVGSLLPERGPGPTPSPTWVPTPLPLLGPVAVCPAGSAPDAPGPADRARPNLEGLPPVAFDRQSGRLVTVTESPRAIWSFDVCSNTWHRSDEILPVRPLALGYDAATDLTVLFTDPVLTYDVDRDVLTTRGRDPLFGAPRHVVYRTATRSFVVREDGGPSLWSYDAVADSWQELTQLGDVPPLMGAELLAYDTSVDRLEMYGAQGNSRWTFEFDFTSLAWSRLGIDTVGVELTYGDLGRFEVAFDEAHARTLVFSRGRAIAYDATAHRWEVVFESFMESDPPLRPNDPTHRQAVSLVYDPVNQRVVAVGGIRRSADTWFVADDLIAFDLTARTWLELLAPGSEVP